MPSKKKIAAKEVESKLSSLPKSKGLTAQPSPSSRMEIESIKSKGLTVSSAKDNVKRQVTRPYLYSMTEGRSKIHPSDTEVLTKNATQAIKAREKKLPAIEVDRKKQQIMEEYKKNKAAGSTKSMNYNAMPVKNEQAKSIMDTENKNLKIGNAKKTEKYIK
jgi:hypothetical protein